LMGGKPKGMLKILCKRGFIDPAKKKENYTIIDGKKDAFGNVNHEISLKQLMSRMGRKAKGHATNPLGERIH
jgi:hypothetical protein